MKHLYPICILTLLSVLLLDTSSLYGQNKKFKRSKRPKHLNTFRSKSFFKQTRKSSRLLDFTGAKGTLDFMAIYGKGERTSLGGIGGDYYLFNGLAVFTSLSVEWGKPFGEPFGELFKPSDVPLGEPFSEKYQAIYTDIGLQWKALRIGNFAASISVAPYFSTGKYNGNDDSRLNGHFFGLVGAGRLTYHLNKYQIFLSAQQRKDFEGTYERFFMGIGAGYSFF